MARSVMLCALAGLTACLLALSGCAGTSSTDAAVDKRDAATVGDAMTQIDDAQYTRITVRDARTNRDLTTVTDPAAISAAFSTFDLDENELFASTDALEPQYELDLWRPGTIHFGQSAEDAGEVHAATITLYRGRDDVITVAPSGTGQLANLATLTLHTANPQVVEHLRTLVP